MSPSTQPVSRTKSLLAGLVIVVALILLSIPMENHYRHQLTRDRIIRDLARIDAEKLYLAEMHGLEEGTEVSLPELVESGWILKQAPVFPADVKVTIGVIGELPRAEYRGETLYPDYEQFFEGDSV